MLLKVSWRNIWRQRRRSLIVMTSIVVGCAAVLVYDSIGIGFVYQKLDTEISNNTSHFQINRKGYNDNKVIANRISSPDETENILKQKKFIRNYSKRVLSFGMLSSAENSTAITIAGIDPAKERSITRIHQTIIRGRYLGSGPNEIVIGKEMSEKLGVDLGGKLVMMAAATDGSVQSEMFRVTGIYDANSGEFNRSYVFIPIKTAQNLLLMGTDITQFAMLVDNTENIVLYKSQLKKSLGSEVEVLSYADLMPLVVMYIETADQMMIVMYVIIGIAVLFGIINTMLMSVFERIQEFGVLMSIGMKNSKIFTMVIAEAFFIGSIGTIVGFIVGLLFYLLLAKTGLDLSAFSKGMTSFGIGSVIYPILNLGVIVRALFVIPLMTVIGAVYPALKAIRLQPTEAMRHI